jgi:hypothetical protein
VDQELVAYEAFDRGVQQVGTLAQQPFTGRVHDRQTSPLSAPDVGPWAKLGGLVKEAFGNVQCVQEAVSGQLWRTPG